VLVVLLLVVLLLLSRVCEAWVVSGVLLLPVQP
jgi:hypothetical protein